MKPTVITKTCKLPDGREITIETGKLARQADGSVVLTMGKTMLLATVVSSETAKEGTDFLPLSVDYQEKFASTGKVPGGFLKRESRLSDYEILISRLVDRAIRPLFPDDYHADTQIMLYLISGDEDSLPDALAAFAASAALSVSDIPFNGPISEVRVARIDGKYVINPSLKDKERADIDLMVGASIENILMVEGEMKEVSEEDMLEALKYAHDAIKDQCRLQIELTEATGKTVKRTYSHETNDEDLRAHIETFYDRVYTAARQLLTNKKERSKALSATLEEYLESLPDDTTVDKALAKRYYKDVVKRASRNLALSEGLRLDGRKTTEVRPIWSRGGLSTVNTWVGVVHPWRDSIVDNSNSWDQA